MALNIAICGGIAVGKTTLGRRISSNARVWEFLEEKPEEASFIQEFYRDKARWAFHSRMGMLAYFLKRTVFLESSNATIIQDRCLHELIVFAEVQRKLGTMRSDEFNLYCDIFNQLCELQRFPDVIIRCVCSPNIALSRVGQRNRAFEVGMQESYIKLIETQYDEWEMRNDREVRFLKVNTDGEVDISDLLVKLNL